jgi:hypothetical protein
MHCRIFNTIPGLYPLGASSNIQPIPQLRHQKCLQAWRQNTQIEGHCSGLSYSSELTKIQRRDTDK